MLAILNSLNAHNLPIFQSILIILVSKLMFDKALLYKHTFIRVVAPFKKDGHTSPIIGQTVTYCDT